MPRRLSRDPHRHAFPAPGDDTAPRTHTPHPPGEDEEAARWHGITWHDVPGHDRAVKKLNFSLLKRGLLRHHEDCRHLEGQALKQRLQETSDRNRKNSLKRNYHPDRPERAPGALPPAPPPAPPAPAPSPGPRSPSSRSSPS